MNLTDGIKDKPVPTRGLSGLQFVSVLFIFTFMSPLALIANGRIKKRKSNILFLIVHIHVSFTGGFTDQHS